MVHWCTASGDGTEHVLCDIVTCPSNEKSQNSGSSAISAAVPQADHIT